MLCSYFTHKGKVRDCNEDYLYADKKMQLFIIADGMGGHKAGDIASKKAVKIIKDEYNKNINILDSSVRTIKKQITKSILKANAEIYDMSLSDPQFSGMGTTITMLSILDNIGLLAHIGDSRAYLMRNNKLKQLTTDHSLVEQMVKEGTITKEQAKTHPQKNIITRAIGTESTIKIDWLTFKFLEKDVIILCTDGLFNQITEDEIRDMVVQFHDDISIIPKKMVTLVNKRGGFDNISVVIVKNEEEALDKAVIGN